MIVRRIFECPSGYFGIGDDLSVERWRSPASAAELRALLAAFRAEMVRREKRPFCTLAIMAMPPSTMLKVSEEERELIMQRILEQGQYALAGVTVIAMGGFSGAVVRGVLGAMFSVRRRRTPSLIAGSLDEGLPLLREMLSTHSKCEVTELEIRRAVDDLVPASWG
jgi:hypothetical protein